MNIEYPLVIFKIILLGIFFYLVGSFASASFLLNEWNAGLRIVIAFTVALFSSFIVADCK